MDDPRDHVGALIGDTPLLELRRLGERRGLRARILAKIEALNPAGSIKDRTAWGIVQAAEAESTLVLGQRLVDLTSGSTGIGLAALAAARATGRSSTCVPRRAARRSRSSTATAPRPCRSTMRSS